MSYDLRRELGALAAEERSAAGALPVDELRTRAHRRRTARAIGASSLAVATVAAVAVAAVAMPGRLRTPPAETPTPTVTTPSPDATAAEWPTAVTFDGAVPGCGDAMPPLVRPDGDPEIAVATTLPTAVLVSGSSVEIAVVISTPPDAPLPAASPELLLVRDGVVVGTNRGPQDGAFTYSSVDGTLTWPAVDVDLVACGTADVGAPALEAGGYELYGVVRLQQDTQELVVVGGPFPVTLDADTTGHALADLILST